MSIPDSMQNKRTRGRPRLMKIPQSFQVFGHTVKVLLVSPEQLHSMDVAENEVPSEYVYGMYHHVDKVIYLDSTMSGDLLETTYLHEKTHCLLEHAGRDDLSEDEGLVDLLSEIEHQISKSLKYNKKSVTKNAQ
jgi:hypothetical protein